MPITESDEIVSRLEPSFVMKTSFTDSRFGIHAIIRDFEMSDGTSFKLCTAKSICFSATALSISFSKIPLWSIVKSALVSVSPFVVIVLISNPMPLFSFFNSGPYYFCNSDITQFVWARESLLPRVPTRVNFSPPLVIIHTHPTSL